MLMKQEVISNISAHAETRLDCEKSLICPKFRGEERNTSERRVVSVRAPRAASSDIAACLSHVKLTVTLARSFVLRSSHGFSRKREISRSLDELQPELKYFPAANMEMTSSVINIQLFTCKIRHVSATKLFKISVPPCRLKFAM